MPTRSGLNLKSFPWQPPAAIEHLTSTFSVHGLSEVLVTDIGTCFTSAEFQEFTEWNPPHSYSSISSSLKWPSRTCSEDCQRGSEESLQRLTRDAISRFLFGYCLTPHTTKGVASAELILGRRPCSHLDLVKPDLRQQVQSKQMVQITT